MSRIFRFIRNALRDDLDDMNDELVKPIPWWAIHRFRPFLQDATWWSNWLETRYKEDTAPKKSGVAKRQTILSTLLLHRWKGPHV